MGKELHHIRDEMRLMKTSFTQSQGSQATAHNGAATAGEDVEMRPATAQQDGDGPNEQQEWGAGSSSLMTPPVVASTVGGEVDVHVARGRKVVFMLL